MIQKANTNSLYELTTKLDEVPCTDSERVVILRLLEAIGCDERGVWSKETIAVIDYVLSILGHIAASQKVFSMELDHDYVKAEEAMRWVRMNVGGMLG